jgi:hypothetical protein
MRNHLATIESLRSQRIFPVSQNGKLALPKELPTKVNGLYWLYTSYDINSIKNCTPSNQKNSVNIPDLAISHHGLSHVCNITNDELLIVYNGVGGVGPKGNGGLRERIQQEFNGGSGTGSLGISKTSLNDLSKWFLSFVIMCNTKQSPEVDVCYTQHGTAYERVWRLEYGWPLLCRH